MSNFLLRAVIAVTALTLAAVKIFRPEIKVDLTLLALVVIAALALFGPKFRIKGLDLGGIKFEFPESKAEPDRPAPAAPATRAAAPSASAVPAVAFETYMERLIKLAPIEMIGAYAVMMAMVQSPSSGFHSPILPWTVFAVFLIATPLYFLWGLRVPPLQSLLTALAFAAWALILPGPFTSIPHYDPIYGALGFLAVMMLLPIAITGVRA